MPVPNPKPKEKEDDYVSRCIASCVRGGKDQDQAAAICYSTFRESKEADDQGIFLTEAELERNAERRLEVDKEDFLASKWSAGCRGGEEKKKKKGEEEIEIDADTAFYRGKPQDVLSEFPSTGMTPEEVLAVERHAQTSSVMGHYEEPIKTGTVPKPGNITDLEDIVLPDSLKPRVSFGSPPRDNTKVVAPKKPGPMDEVELPDKFKAKPYGRVTEDPDLKQP